MFRLQEVAIAPADALAAWIRHTGSAWLLLANDSGQKVGAADVLLRGRKKQKLHPDS